MPLAERPGKGCEQETSQTQEVHIAHHSFAHAPRSRSGESPGTLHETPRAGVLERR
jgi:hypothetical protein